MIAAPVAGKFDDADYQLFQQKVLTRTGIRLQDYKADQMRRRIASLSTRAGCRSFSEFYFAMERDRALFSRFLDGMTINVTEMLRNPERFADLQTRALPPLLGQRAGQPLSVWSAGCSYGAECFSIAMILQELAPNANHRIEGTDLDQGVLEKADAACLSESDMANVSAALRDRYFVDAGGGTFRPGAKLRAMVRFSRHDLLADPFPPGAHDLILCRNVLIYFTEEAKVRIYQGFFHSLRPGGVLFVGGTERLHDHRAIGFELIMPFFYRKPA